MNALRRIRTLLLKGIMGIVISLVLVEICLQALALGRALFFEREEASYVDNGDQAYRIVCVGDSHTYGVHLDPEQSYPGRLEQILNDASAGTRFQVINRGVPGMNTAQIRHHLDDILDRFSPDLLLVLAGLNNQWNNAYSHYWTSNEETSEDEASTPNFSLWSFRTYRLFNLALASLKDDGFKETDDDSRVQRAPNRTDYREYQFDGQETVLHEERGDSISDSELARVTALDLAIIAKRAKERGAQVILQTYAIDRGNRFNQVNHGIREAARKRDTPLVEHSPQFDSLDEEIAFLVGDSHPSPLGYLTMAKALALKIREWTPELDEALIRGQRLSSQEKGILRRRNVERSDQSWELEISASPGARYVLRSLPAESLLGRSVIAGELDANGHATMVLPIPRMNSSSELTIYAAITHIRNPLHPAYRTHTDSLTLRFE